MGQDIAVFLDLDNLVIGAKQANLNFDVNLILDHIKRETNGRVVLRKAYGDWRQNQKQLEQLTAAGFHTHSHMRLNHHSKNLADMQIVVDTMETLVDGQEFGIYVLLTGDRDFTPLVQSLRKRGKKVVGVGLKHTASRSFVDLCDEYLYYEDLLPKPELSQEQIKVYLEQAVDELLQDEKRVRASILKEKLMALTDGEFDKVQLGKGSFRKFLDLFPDIVSIEQDGTTTYVCRPQPVLAERPLHLRYRSELKKQHLRVIAHKQRLPVLNALITYLQRSEQPRWREIIDALYEQYQSRDAAISKNVINAVMLVARRADIIHTVKSRSLSTAPVMLQLTGDSPYRQAVMMCDELYLQSILDLPVTFVLAEAALALYDDEKFVPYLQAIMNRWQQE